MVHQITERRAPGSFLVRCSCGWSVEIRKQNALARAAKIRRAIREHQESAAAKAR